MNKLVIANWKMNPRTEDEAVELARGEDIDNAVICPPFLFLEAVGSVLKKARLGAQDLFWEDPPGGGGAYTGEVSVSMLRDAGVEYVIVGHSERRDPPAGGGDTDEIVAKKVKAVLEGGLTPILCVGERERKLEVISYKLKDAKEFVGRQLQIALSGIYNLQLTTDNFIVAYEPVWAISSRSAGVSDTPESAGEMIRFLRNELKVISSKLSVRVLYGGSVNSRNAKEFLGRSEIDGVLVGAASLRSEEFGKIAEMAVR